MAHSCFEATDFGFLINTSSYIMASFACLDLKQHDSVLPVDIEFLLYEIRDISDSSTFFSMFYFLFIALCSNDKGLQSRDVQHPDGIIVASKQMNYLLRSFR